MLRALLPRLLLVVVAAPLVAALLASALPRFHVDPVTPAAVGASIAFAAVALAPSTINGAIRAAIVVAIGGVVALASLLA